MTRSGIRYFACLVAATALYLPILQPCPVLAAKKVPTERIIVPEDDAKPGEELNSDDTAGPKSIPQDALPKVEDTLPKDDAAKDENGDENEDESGNQGSASTPAEQQAPPPPILRDLSKLPEPVRRMRDLLLKAANTGDIEKLRPLIGIGETAATLSFGGLEGDPIAFLKDASGDDEGFEILAILIEVLEAGYVHVDAGTEEELYVWPYFFAWPLDKLTPEMKVELFRLLTAGDVADSKDFGAYIFYRVGIRPDGQWVFFVAGD